MRYLIISDIHANLEALQAVLAALRLGVAIKIDDGARRAAWRGGRAPAPWMPPW